MYTTEFIHCAWLAASFLALFGIAELIYFLFQPKAEYTRKFVHIGTGLLTLLFPLFLQSVWSVLFLCGSFAVLLSFSLRFHFLRSINGIQRRSHGSISYPAAVFIVFLFYTFQKKTNGEQNLLNFYLPVLMLAICDPLAALIGKRWPYKTFKVGEGRKSWTGVSVFFLSALTLAIVLMNWFLPEIPVLIVCGIAVALAAVGALSEALSPLGLDNVMIPAGQVICLLCAEYFLAG